MTTKLLTKTEAATIRAAGASEPSALEPKTAKTAKPKTAKTAKPKTGDHAFLATKDEPAKCSVCSGSPSDKRHRRALDRMRKVWWTETAAVKADYLTRIGFAASAARSTWTELTVEAKHLLAAALAKAEAK